MAWELDLVYRSDSFREILRKAERAASSTLPVMILGESGTGKGRVARTIHEKGPRRGRPYRIWSAPEAPATLALSELFGVVRGAFTGAFKDSPGILELADKSTLIIDDIDKLSAELQAGLLRFLDEGSVRPIGSKVSRTFDVRLLFTTNRNLRSLGRDGLFLPDLANRLFALTISIPPLRERREDIAPLVQALAIRSAMEAGIPTPIFTDGAMAMLEAEPWPGNVREVSGLIQNLVFWSGAQGLIDVEAVKEALCNKNAMTSTLQESEVHRLSLLPVLKRRSREVVSRVHEIFEGNGVKSAHALRIPLRSFRRLLRAYGLTKRRRFENSKDL